MPVLVAFAHLRWGSFCQRPQQLLSRLARRWPVLYVEAPVRTDGAAHLERRTPSHNVEVLTPYTPLAAPGFDDRQCKLIAPLLAAHLAARHADAGIAWFYTPAAWPLATLCQARTVVYDCVDEPAAPARAHEHALLAGADLVLTAGPALYAAKRKRNANVVCLPSAVDAAHFSPAHLTADGDEPREAARLCAGIGAPRLGFFGVIDERIDLELIALLADAHADWQIAMAGPVRGLASEALPRRANLHWLGTQPYARLPHLMAHWDLCLMPFAVNARTQHLNPDKTLEYMAGEKPIVSTALPDVVALHSGAVRIAHDAKAFIAACEQTLAEPAHKRSRRIAEMLSTVSCASWERSATSVAQLLEREWRAQPRTAPARTPLLAPSAA